MCAWCRGAVESQGLLDQPIAPCRGAVSGLRYDRVEQPVFEGLGGLFRSAEGEVGAEILLDVRAVDLPSTLIVHLKTPITAIGAISGQFFFRKDFGRTIIEINRESSALVLPE